MAETLVCGYIVFRHWIKFLYTFRRQRTVIWLFSEIREISGGAQRVPVIENQLKNWYRFEIEDIVKRSLISLEIGIFPESCPLQL